MIIAVVGSRHYKPVALLNALLDRLEAKHPDLTIISGGEPTGVDNAIEEICRERGYCDCWAGDGIEHLDKPRHFAAMLPENGSARAKFARNSKVVRHAQEVIALFGDVAMSPGTSDTVAKARKAGLPTYVHHMGQWR